MALDLGDPYDFLASAISPPDTNSVRNALMFLDGLSAVYIHDNEVGNETHENGKHTKPGKENNSAVILKSQITPLGRALFPIHLRNYSIQFLAFTYTSTHCMV